MLTVLAENIAGIAIIDQSVPVQDMLEGLSVLAATNDCLVIRQGNL
jgi:hypothetical protein